MAKETKVGGGYVELSARLDRLQKDLNAGERMTKQAVGRMNSLAKIDLSGGSGFSSGNLGFSKISALMKSTAADSHRYADIIDGDFRVIEERMKRVSPYAGGAAGGAGAFAGLTAALTGALTALYPVKKLLDEGENLQKEVSKRILAMSQGRGDFAAVQKQLPALYEKFTNRNALSVSEFERSVTAAYLISQTTEGQTVASAMQMGSNIALASGNPMVETMELLAQASQGSTKDLSKLGIHLAGGQTTAQTMEVAERFSAANRPAAEAYAKTPVEKYSRTKAKAGGFLENVGYNMLEGFGMMGEGISSAWTGASDFIGEQILTPVFEAAGATSAWFDDRQNLRRNTPGLGGAKSADYASRVSDFVNAPFDRFSEALAENFDPLKASNSLGEIANLQSQAQQDFSGQSPDERRTAGPNRYGQANVGVEKSTKELTDALDKLTLEIQLRNGSP